MFYSKNHEPIPWSFLIVGILILIILLCMRSCSSSISWNDGICPVCGGHYKYLQAVGHYYFTDYIYICDNCGRSIEVAHHYAEIN